MSGDLEIQDYGEKLMESSPWKLINKNLKAVEFVAASMNFALEDCGTHLPDDPKNGQIFTLVDSLTAPTYIWTFRYNESSISIYRWEFIGGLFATIFGIDTDVFLNTFTNTHLRNAFNDYVYYKSGSTFSLPYTGEYEFTGGVIASSDMDGTRISTQIIFDNFSNISIAWPSVLKRGFNYIPFPLKRFSRVNAGKISFGIGSNIPSDIKIRWSTCVVRPVKIQY